MNIPKNYEVQPLKPGQAAKDRVTCGTCGLSWDDGVSTSMTPSPSGRCPFEYFHDTCPNNLLPDGPVCPRCGQERAPSGVDGGSWVHFTTPKKTPVPVSNDTDLSNETRAALARMACDYLNGKVIGPSALMRLETILACAYLRGRKDAK